MIAQSTRVQKNFFRIGVKDNVIFDFRSDFQANRTKIVEIIPFLRFYHFNKINYAQFLCSPLFQEGVDLRTYRFGFKTFSLVPPTYIKTNFIWVPPWFQISDPYLHCLLMINEIEYLGRARVFSWEEPFLITKWSCIFTMFKKAQFIHKIVQNLFLMYQGYLQIDTKWSFSSGSQIWSKYDHFMTWRHMKKRYFFGNHF